MPLHVPAPPPFVRHGTLGALALALLTLALNLTGEPFSRAAYSHLLGTAGAATLTLSGLCLLGQVTQGAHRVPHGPPAAAPARVDWPTILGLLTAAAWLLTAELALG